MTDGKEQPSVLLNDGRDEPQIVNIEKKNHKTDNEENRDSQDVSQGTKVNKGAKISPTTEDQAVPANELQRVSTEKDYSSFTNWEKKFIVFAATMGAFFSPFTTQIYFPAITSIAKDLHVSNSKINLTMTTYMVRFSPSRYPFLSRVPRTNTSTQQILQAIAPAFIGNLSDTAGRSPGYIASFTIYIIADIALALQKNYVALLVLRMVQSAGSSGTVALANAVIADIATSAERGIYIGITSSATILAPSLGPILGGILSQYAGWKWIFWFLAIFARLFFIPMLLFMPETCRKIVGDGSIPPPSWNRSLMNHIDVEKEAKLNTL